MTGGTGITPGASVVPVVRLGDANPSCPFQPLGPPISLANSPRRMLHDLVPPRLVGYMVRCRAMHKTTVYLPDDLKIDLERTAAETRRSEADLIREGVRLAIEHYLPPAPRSGIFDSGDPSLAERVDDLLQGFGED